MRTAPLACRSLSRHAPRSHKARAVHHTDCESGGLPRPGLAHAGFSSALSGRFRTLGLSAVCGREHRPWTERISARGKALCCAHLLSKLLAQKMPSALPQALVLPGPPTLTHLSASNQAITEPRSLPSVSGHLSPHRFPFTPVNTRIVCHACPSRRFVGSQFTC